MTKDIIFLIPELIIIFTTVTILLLESNNSTIKRCEVFSNLGTALAAVSVFFLFKLIQDNDAGTLVFSVLRVTIMSIYIKIILYVSCFFTSVLIKTSSDIDNNKKIDLLSLVMLVTLSFSVLITSTNLILSLLLLEVTSFGMVYMSAISKFKIQSNFVSVNKFKISAISTAIMVLLVWALYTLTGSFDLTEQRSWIIKAFANPELKYLVGYFGAVLILILFLFFMKIRTMPFQFFYIDELDGTSTAVSFYLSIVPISAFLFTFVRWLLELVLQSKKDGAWIMFSGFEIKEIISLISIFTITIGTFGTLGQKKIKRFFSYACLSMTGWSLLGLVSMNEFGLSAMFFSLISTMFIFFGIYFVIQKLEDEIPEMNIQDLSIVWSNNPALIVLFCLFIFSFIGVPPFSGFLNRFYLMSAAIEDQNYLLVSAAMANWIVGTAQLLIFVKSIFINSKNIKTNQETKSKKLFFGYLSLGIILYFGIAGDVLMHQIRSVISQVSNYL